MKTTLAILALFLVTTSLVAADDTGGRAPGFYVQPTMEVSTITKSPANWLALRAGCQLTPQVSVGAQFSTLVSSHVVSYSPGPMNESFMYRTTVAYACLLATYVPWPKPKVRPAVDLLVGDGWLGLATPPIRDMRRARFWIVEPAVRLEAALIGRMQISSGLGYRFTHGIDGFGFTDRDVSRLAWSVGLRCSTL